MDGYMDMHEDYLEFDSGIYLVSEEELYSSEFMAGDRHVVSLIIIIIVIILSLIGNILVVVVSVCRMRLRSLTSIFILNLALSDLLFTAGLFFWVCGHTWGSTLGDTACKVSSLIFSAGYYSSIVFLVLMSIQHYIAIVHPVSSWKKGRWVKHILICAWMVSILASLPVVFHNAALSYTDFCTGSNITAFVAGTYKESIVFVCAFLFMGFCYIRILQTIFKSPTNQRHRTTRLAFLLAATSFICWAPYNIVNFLVTLSYHVWDFNQDFEHFGYATYICQLLALTRCCLNPVIYGLFGLIFRKTAQKIFQRRATSEAAQMAIQEHHSGS